MEKMRYVILMCCLVVIGHLALAQDGVGIGTDVVDPSAILHLKSADKGLLLPSVDVEGDRPVGPKNGLILYNNDTEQPGTPGFFSYENNHWVNVFPKGGIIMWTGSTPPQGWGLCDGRYWKTDGTSQATACAGCVKTPNLIGRFIVGFHPHDDDSDYGDIGNRGGDATITATEMVRHSHTINHGHGVIDPGHNHNAGAFERLAVANGAETNKSGKDKGTAFGEPNLDTTKPLLRSTTGITVRDHNGSSGTAGGLNAQENRPPYYVLAFIMKL